MQKDSVFQGSRSQLQPTMKHGNVGKRQENRVRTEINSTLMAEGTRCRSAQRSESLLDLSSLETLHNKTIVRIYIGTMS